MAVGRFVSPARPQPEGGKPPAEPREPMARGGGWIGAEAVLYSVGPVLGAQGEGRGQGEDGLGWGLGRACLTWGLDPA